MDWLATPKQKQFIEAREDEVLYGGAAGGGKSDALLIFSILRRAAIPGSRGLILRRTYAELERSLILRSLELLSGRATYNAGNHRWRFPNGSMIEFGYCERDEDVYHYQSAEYEDICFDELTQFGEFQYTYLLSRLRTTKPGVRCLVRAATNPGGVGHGWVKQRFIDVATPGEVYTDVATGRTRRFIPAKLDDNPHIDADYSRRLDELPEAERRALKDGDWDVFAGQYFREWSRDIHVIRPIEIPHWWRRFRSLDYGLDCCACYWWAVGPDQRCYIYRELYQPDLRLSEAAKKILAMTPEGEKIDYTVASPDLWNRNQHTGFSGAEVMQREGLLLRPADNARIPGWRALREYLAPYRDEQGVQTAHLLVFDHCTNLIRTLPMLIHDNHDPEDADTEPHEVTHGPDSVRYGIMSRPPLSQEPVKPAYKLPWALQTEESRKSGYLEW